MEPLSSIVAMSCIPNEVRGSRLVSEPEKSIGRRGSQQAWKGARRRARRRVRPARESTARARGCTAVASLWEMGRRLVACELGPSASRWRRISLDGTLLRQAREFYRAFPKRGLLRRELGWTHYKTLCRVPNA